LLALFQPVDCPINNKARALTHACKRGSTMTIFYILCSFTLYNYCSLSTVLLKKHLTWFAAAADQPRLLDSRDTNEVTTHRNWQWVFFPLPASFDRSYVSAQTRLWKSRCKRCNISQHTQLYLAAVTQILHNSAKLWELYGKENILWCM